MHRAVKIVFGERQKFMPLVGTRFTQEEELGPCNVSCCPRPLHHQPPARVLLQRCPPGLKIITPTVTLQSAPKAPPEAVAAAASASSRPAAKTSDQLPSPASLPSGYRMAYFMEDHLPEYEYTLMVNAYAEEVPAINFSCACDELELITSH